MTNADARARPSILDALWNSPMLLLSLTALMWGGNSVAGRLAVGEISPMALVFWRWALACVPLLIVARANLKADIEIIRPRWRYIALAAILGFTAFNSLFYISAHQTSAVNISILQGIIPGVVVIGAWCFYGIRLRSLQAVGVLITMAGVVVIAARGDWATLRTLDFNFGDVLMIVAAVLYATYILLLRRRPAAVTSIGLFTAMAVVAFVTSAPLLIIEIAEGQFFWPSAKGLAVLAYVALFPSLISQIFFMRGVQLIGPSRAGVFVNLVPIFGALLAVLLLGEPFAFYHAASLCMVLAGLWLAERSARTV